MKEPAAWIKINSMLEAAGWLDMLPAATQTANLVEIQAGQKLVAANRELVARFGQKIRGTLARIWGEETSATAYSEPAPTKFLAAESPA